jgi:3-deoxy-D-manno-octulosonate 8-phosphate phosphatase (KDO 8-P phosphatase)
VVSAPPGDRSRDLALRKAKPIRFLLTDCDGVLTDTGVYYGSRGEELKRFSVRDGMGVERLRAIAGIETGILSGESTSAIARRAEKLTIRETHLGVKDKLAALEEIAQRRRLDFSQIAYIGDDINDLPALAVSGLSACPRDAMPEVVACVDYVCSLSGGHGAFREFAELLIHGAEGSSWNAIQ